MRPKDLLVWSVGIVMALILTIYACDFLWFEYRKWTPKPDDPLETFTFFYGTRVKNGRMEVFYDQPQKATCVHALFPHGGYLPCWYLRKSDIKEVSLIDLDDGRGDSRDRGWGLETGGLRRQGGSSWRSLAANFRS